MINFSPKYRLFDHDEKAMWEVSSINWYGDRSISFIGVENDHAGVLEFYPNKDNISLMLDIGCKDKNGKLIYDFDVLKFVISSGTFYSVMYFNNKRLRYTECCIDPKNLEYICKDLSLISNDMIEGEVIGNIFEDKDLGEMFKEFLKELQNS